MEKSIRRQSIWSFIFCAVCIALNIICSSLAQKAGTLMYFDTAGTILAAAVGGYLPGVIVGLLTNIIKGISDPSSVYYGVLSVLIALVVGLFSDKGMLQKLKHILLCILCISLIGGGLGTLMPWFIDGVPLETASFSEVIYNTGLFNVPAAEMTANLLVDLADKSITMCAVLIAMRILKPDTRQKLRFKGWRQKPLSKEEIKTIRSANTRKMSLRTKVLAVMSISLVAVAIAATTISVALYRTSIIEEHSVIATGVATLAGQQLDPERIDEYMEKGEAAEGYSEIKAQLYNIRASYPDIEYVYVYRIEEDGCHVVFDLDTDELEGDSPGTVIEFDKSFESELPKLLAGEEIEPMISDDSYGYLLTAYAPVKNSAGETVCYAAADVSMHQLTNDLKSFGAGVISLFLGFFIVIISFVLWAIEFNMTFPVNSMAESARSFAYDSESARETTVDRIRELEIATGDEIENLYYALLRTTEDCVAQVADIQEKGETIGKMQKALVMVLADMVESRDKCTGDHVRKTAAYTGILLRKLREMGCYTDQISDQFISDVVNSAPLHDIGKISISDAILNKPGRLTDEEFEIMKTHTTAGAEVIDEAIERVPESGYLTEARNLALYHHEKWNGKGYPTGISGEEIPLSARVMAVADVFDALVSRRSYKEPFSFEKACDIIREGSGNHFDPKIVEAFFASIDDVREVAERFEQHGADYADPFA